MSEENGTPDSTVKAGTTSAEMALCLSGGGYRAASYHLGALDVLERLGLADRVRVLATISGGTLLGVLWTLSQVRRQAFGDFFRGVYRTLLRRNVVSEAFERLAATAGEKRPPSLARAAAEVYASEDMVGAATLGELMDTQAGPDDVLFCATEMQRGLAFRFQASRRSEVVVGSRDVLRIPPEVARQIRLADVLAASACFPGAFEPMLYPTDFVLPTAATSESVALPLVDGGVFDNHGIDAARRVYVRRNVEPGLILVSDSSPRASDIYRDPEARQGGGLSLGRLLWLSRGLALLAALLAFSILRDFWQAGIFAGILAGEWQKLGMVGLTDVVALFTSLAIFLLLFVGRRRLEAELGKVREMTGVKVWSGLEKVSFTGLLELIDRRARTLAAITSTVFLKRIRSLQQEICFVDSKLRDRVVFSLIYTLLEPNRALLRTQPWLAPGDQLQAAAKRAEEVGTRLWTDDEAELRATITTGQATTLHKLCELYYLGRRPELKAILGPDFEERARALWSTLQADPEALLKDRL